MSTLQSLVFFTCICFKVTQTEASSWIVRVPPSVKGLLGSCVVIPCSYKYPHAAVNKFTGIWKTTEGHQVICHSIQSETPENYRSRTKLLGDLSTKNCSLMIEDLHQSDGGPFYFRIELGGYSKYSYFNEKVSISVTGEPNPIDFSVEELKEGQTVSASCSVSHSCPTYPPAFQWSHSGEQCFQAQELENGQWEATSTLTFHPNRTDHNKPLQCRLTYHGGKHQEISRTLNVKYAPVNVKVEHQSDVNEGETVNLKCSSDANPASSYEWHSETGALLHEGQSYTMSNVSRHSAEALYCTAVNEEGRVRSSPVQLSVLYAPEIKTSSKCSSEGGVVKCECIVESKPPSMVHFVLADRVLQSSKVGKRGSVTTGTLQTDLGSFEVVHCLANNTLGNANLTLSLLVNANMQNIFIASGVGVGLLIILIATGVGILKKWWRSGDNPTSDLSSMKADRAVESPQYTATKRNENYRDVHCNAIYPSDHVYDNIRSDWDESIYANV